ncbi:MAG: PPC domain-containing protein [Victivallaceae bacterium]|nr:PPC domain-containing protein [Victivallaceae bacterium]
MKRFTFFLWTLVLLAPCFSLPLAANDAPYLGYLYPSGARRGTQIRLLIGGQKLWSVRDLYLSGGGVRLRKIVQVPNLPPVGGDQRQFILRWLDGLTRGEVNPPPPSPRNDLSEWRRSPWFDNLTELDEFEKLLLVRDLMTPRNSLQAAPALRQMVILDLEIAPDAKVGMRELRVVTWGKGVSAPKYFFIDAEPHFAESFFDRPDRSKSESVLCNQVPAVLDGRIMPGETDQFRVALEKGKQYTFTVVGREFQPFIGDAVPGFFQPVLTLAGPDGKTLLVADDEYFRPDPVMRFRAEESGIYTLSIRDNLYRGREDFVYRIALAEGFAPYPKGVNPFPGKPIAANDAAKQILPFCPGAVIGGVLAQGKTETFRFQGKKGDAVVLQVAARSVGSPLDGTLRVRDSRGKVIAQGDDTPSALNIGSFMQQVDPRIAFTVPEDALYTVELSDVAGQGGADYFYYLKAGAPRPDFRLYTNASYLNARPNSSDRITVHAERLDGFDGDIVLRCDMPYAKGKTVLRKGKNSAVLSIAAKLPFTRAVRPLVIRGEGKTADGKSLVHEAVIADEFIQAFAYTHLLPAGELLLGHLPLPRAKKK